MDHPTLPSFVPLATTADGACRALRWDAQQLRWWWTAPDLSCLGCVHGAGLATRRRLPEPVQTLAPCASGQLLAASLKRLCLLPHTGKARAALPTVLATVDAADLRTIIGDGHTDGHGCFVFGTWNMAADAHAIGSYFQFSPQHGLRRLALPTDVRPGNICFSADGATMVFGSADGAALMRCHYDSASAQVDSIRPWIAAEAGWRFVDTVMDEQDGAWAIMSSAGASAGDRLVRFGANGRLLGQRALDYPELGGEGVASLAFGGAWRDSLALLGRQGALLVARVADARGVAATPFNDRHWISAPPPQLPNPPQPVLHRP